MPSTQNSKQIFIVVAVMFTKVLMIQNKKRKKNDNFRVLLKIHFFFFK